MRLFNRISSTILSSVDRVVSQVENHDAVVESMLKEIQSSAAEARIRLRRVQKDGQAMQQRLQELKQADLDWSERAKTSAETDEQKALLCLQRRQQCRGQIEKLDMALSQHSRLEQQLVDNVKNIDARLQEVSQQRNVMKSRQAVSEAMRVIGRINGETERGVEDAFDRWEVSITRSEITAGHIDDLSCDPLDELEAEFVSSEQQAQLRHELEELIGKSKSEGTESEVKSHE
ncbi:MAG: PspA/IM30 family protein [Arenicella sp.]